MSNYTPTTDFSAKDSLATGDPEKVISGADVDVELDAINVAVATKIEVGNQNDFTKTQTIVPSSGAALLTGGTAAQTTGTESMDVQVLGGANVTGVLLGAFDVTDTVRAIPP